MYRIMTIMKSSSEAENIGKDSSLMMTKAAELFIKMLSREGYKLANGGRSLEYKHVAEVVQRDERYEFLRDIMPKKITYAEYKKMQGIQENRDESETEDDDESDSGTSSGSSQ